MSKYHFIKTFLIGWWMIMCSHFTVRSNGIGWYSSQESLIYYAFDVKSPYHGLRNNLYTACVAAFAWLLHITMHKTTRIFFNKLWCCLRIYCLCLQIVWSTLSEYKATPFRFNEAFTQWNASNVNVTTICMQLLCDLFSNMLVRGQYYFLQAGIASVTYNRYS